MSSAEYFDRPFAGDAGEMAMAHILFGANCVCRAQFDPNSLRTAMSRNWSHVEVDTAGRTFG